MLEERLTTSPRYSIARGYAEQTKYIPVHTHPKREILYISFWRQLNIWQGNQSCHHLKCTLTIQSLPSSNLWFITGSKQKTTSSFWGGRGGGVFPPPPPPWDLKEIFFYRKHTFNQDLHFQTGNVESFEIWSPCGLDKIEEQLASISSWPPFSNLCLLDF